MRGGRQEEGDRRREIGGGGQEEGDRRRTVLIRGGRQEEGDQRRRETGGGGEEVFTKAPGERQLGLLMTLPNMAEDCAVYCSVVQCRIE